MRSCQYKGLKKTDMSARTMFTHFCLWHRNINEYLCKQNKTSNNGELSQWHSYLIFLFLCTQGSVHFGEFRVPSKTWNFVLIKFLFFNQFQCCWISAFSNLISMENRPSSRPTPCPGIFCSHYMSKFVMRSV